MSEVSTVRQSAGIAAPFAEAVRWVRKTFFDGWFNSFLTLVSAAMVVAWGPDLFVWAIGNAVWSTTDPETCRDAGGACWAVIEEKHRPMLFGVYPYDEHWRLVVALVTYFGAVCITLMPRAWSTRILVPLWVSAVSLIGVMMWGGVFGLTYVDTSQWGGLPLTMVLFSGTVVMGIPLSVVLALGRRSKLPIISTFSVTFIETLRGVPLITILFVAVNVFPLFLPEGVEFSKLLRVMVGMSIFFACYVAEVIRGGLQAIPRGQYEAAEALGLTYWQTMLRIVLPQALRICLPGIVNHIVAALKNTSYVLIIGLFDILTATNAVMDDPLWRRYYVETYLFVALVYFVFCHALSRYMRTVERWIDEGRI